LVAPLEVVVLPCPAGLPAGQGSLSNIDICGLARGLNTGDMVRV